MNISSDTEDLLDLAYKLKSALGSKIKIINFDREDSILVGVYNDNNLSIKFSMAFNSNSFLKIKFYSEGNTEYESHDFALLLSVISELEDTNGNKIGYPQVYYKEGDIISYDWIFTLEKIEEQTDEVLEDEGNLSLLERIANKMPKRR